MRDSDWIAIGLITALVFGVVTAAAQAQDQGTSGTPPYLSHPPIGSRHHWYPQWCCDEKDCAPAKPGTLRREDAGWTYLPTGKYIPDEMTMVIPDRASDEDKARPHICLRQYESINGPVGSVICNDFRCCFFPGEPNI